MRKLNNSRVIQVKWRGEQLLDGPDLKYTDRSRDYNVIFFTEATDWKSDSDMQRSVRMQKSRLE